MKQAKERGHNLSLTGLRILHEYRLLVPFTALVTRRCKVAVLMSRSMVA